MEIPFKLRLYEQRIERMMAVAREHYAQVRLYIFSDHGMANCNEFLDLQPQISKLGLQMGKDFAAVYDSTMVRFWFFNAAAKEKVVNKLGEIPQGRVVPEAELRQLRTYFPDGYFGELIFLVKEGVLIRDLVRREKVLPENEIDDVLDLRKMTEIGVPGSHS